MRGHSLKALITAGSLAVAGAGFVMATDDGPSAEPLEVLSIEETSQARLDPTTTVLRPTTTTAAPSTTAAPTTTAPTTTAPTTTVPTPPPTATPATTPPPTQPPPTQPPPTQPPATQPPTTQPPAPQPPAPGPVRNGSRDTACENDMVNRINSARADAGRGSVGNDTAIASIPVAWSDAMSGHGGISHNPHYADQILQYRDYRIAAENVGTGPDLAVLFRAFMDSPGHRANIVDGRLRYVSVGCVRSGNTYYVTQNFWG